MKKIVRIYVEEYQGQLLAYRSQDDRFLAQGQSVQDLFTRLAQYIPTGARMAFVLDKERGGDLVVDRAIEEKSSWVK